MSKKEYTTPNEINVWSSIEHNIISSFGSVFNDPELNFKILGILTAVHPKVNVLELNFLKWAWKNAKSFIRKM